MCVLPGHIAKQELQKETAMKNICLLPKLIIIVSAFAQTITKIISTKTEKDVIPEGITIDPVKEHLWAALHTKNYRIDSSGINEDFIKTNQDGFLEGLGMKIDAEKHWLWQVE
jgi:hypothetical protein